MNRFEGRTVFVTGAGSGIGWEMATQFAAEGATVYSADRDVSGCADGTVAVEVDVTEEAAIVEGFARARNETGRIDVLCNNAGLASVTDPLDCSAEEWDRVFAVNARGVFLGVKHVLPTMLAQGRGAIVNTASVAGMVGLVDRTAYCASKGAVIALTKQVAVQYAKTGVRCNALCPGTVDSPWVARVLDRADDAGSARQALVDRQPMGRLGTPREIAAAALYLASDDAEYVTGTALVIDGGLVAG